MKHSRRLQKKPFRLTFILTAAAIGAAACGETSGDQAQPRATRADAADDRRPAVERPKAALLSHGPRHRRRVALTFDADMTRAKLAELRASGDAAVSDWYDERIVEELERTQTPATVFMSGLWAQAHPEAARALARSPLFQIENHSLSHLAFSSPCYGLETPSSQPEKHREVVRSSEVIEEITGERPRFFRFPGGCHSREDLQLVASAGEQPLGWDVVSGDVGQPDPSAVVREVLEVVRPGSIVVMHLVGAPNAPATAAAVRELIPALRERGYEPVTLDVLLAPGGTD
jgi:peptidoglycan-N-acetylglucosamine deacetylase